MTVGTTPDLRSLGRSLRRMTNSRVLLAAFMAFALAVAALFALDDQNAWARLADGIVSALLAAGCVSLFWELSSRRAFVDEVSGMLQLREDLASAGISRLMLATTLTAVDLSDAFREAKKVDILAIYTAGGWRDQYLNELTTLVSKRRSKIRLILPNPENVAVIDEISRRFSTTPAELQGNIQRAIAFFSDLTKSRPCELEVYLIDSVPMYAYYSVGGTSLVWSFLNERRLSERPILAFPKDTHLGKVYGGDFEASIKLAKRHL